MLRAASWLVWFAGLFALWLLLVGTIASPELVAGLLAAAIGATAAAVALHLGPLRQRLEARSLAVLWRPALRAFPEYFRVLGCLLNGRRGAFRTLELPGGQRRTDAGRRALLVFAASIAPGRVVADIDTESGIVVVHDLGGGGSSELA